MGENNKTDNLAVTSPKQTLESAEAGEAEVAKSDAIDKDEEATDPENNTKQSPTNEAESKARPSSFAGLPVLRRSSTFEPSFGDKVITETNDGDSDDENQGATLNQKDDVDRLPTIADTRPPSAAPSNGEDKTLEGQTIGNENVTTKGQLLDLAKEKSALAQAEYNGGAEDRAAATGDIPKSPKSPAGDRAPPTNPQSTLPAAGPGLGRNLPEHMRANPIQRPPPHGQWNLQESYLSEPLISPSRKRPMSPSSQQESFTELDKETGAGGSVNTMESSDNNSFLEKDEESSKPVPERPVERPQGSEEQPQPQEPRPQTSPAVNTAPFTAPAPPDQRPPPAPPGNRGVGQKYGATPPVSMQRYRGLFASKPSPPQAYGQPGQPTHSPGHPNLAEPSGGPPDSTVTHPPRSSSRPSTADDRSRPYSGIFSQFGERFTKSNATGANADSATDSTDDVGAPAPEQRHRRRSSFFLNLKKDATEPGPKSGDSNFANPPSTLDDRSISSPALDEPPKRSFFGVGKPRTPTGGSARFISAALGRSSTGHVEGDEKEKEKPRFMPTFSRPSTGNPDEDTREGKPRFIPASFTRSSTASGDDDSREGKPRFGGLGMFRRGTPEAGEKPGSSRSRASSIQSRPATGTSIQQGIPLSHPQHQGAADHKSLPLPPTRGRSGTTGSMPGAPSPLAQASAPPEDRGRKVSGPGAFLSNIFHARSPSRSKEGRLPKQTEPQLGPNGLPLGMAPASQQGAPRPASFGKTQAGQMPLHQRRTSAPSPAGSPQRDVPRSPTHQRQGSVPEASSPLSRRSATAGSMATEQPQVGQLPPAQRMMFSTGPQTQSFQTSPQANHGQGRPMQDPRPIAVRQAGTRAAQISGQSAAPESQVLEGASATEEARAGLVAKPDAPTKTSTEDEGGAALDLNAAASEEHKTGPAQGLNDETGDPTAEPTPKLTKPPSIHEPERKDGEPSMPVINEPTNTDGKPGVPAISEPADKGRGPSRPSMSEGPNISSAPSSRSPTPQPEDFPMPSGGSSVSTSGALTSSTQSIASATAKSRSGVSVTEDKTGEQTPQASSPALSQGPPVSSPTQSRVSAGRTVSPVTSSAAATPMPQGQMSQRQTPQGRTPAGPVPGQIPGQLVQGQPVPGQPPHPQHQGQWRPYAPNQAVAGQQMPQGPGAVGMQGPPVPWPPSRASTGVSNASGSQQSNSPMQFQPMPAPMQQQQQQQQYQQQQQPQHQQAGQTHSGVSKWFKGITTSSQQHQQQQQQTPHSQHPGQGKTEKAKALLGAFKRSSKPASAKPSAPQQQVSQQQVPQQGQQPAFGPGGYPQQYAQPYVLHPQYGMVPAVQQMGPYGPVLQPAHPIQPGQQFVPGPYPGTFQPVPFAPGQAPFQPYAPGQVQVPSVPPSRQPSVVSSHLQGTVSSSGSPAVQGPSVVPGQFASPQTMSPASQSPAVSAPQPAPPASQVQGSTGPQPGENQTHTGGTQRPAGIPTLVSPDSNAAQSPATEPSKTVAALEQAVGRASHSRGVSQASLKPVDAKRLTVDTDAATYKSDETNLYDATPRLGAAQTDGTNSASQNTPQSPPPTQPTEPPTQSTEPSTSQSTEPTTQGTQQEQKPAESTQREMIRRMRLEAQDEKILVPGQEGLPGSDEQPNDDQPKMSATSYPGQEWNPYGGYEVYYND